MKELATLEEQVLMPFQDPVEMGMTLSEVVTTVR
ncbi:cytochrome-c peroxidase [Flavobacterium tibetense]|jgi:cytochrome c peroxidase|nr:cytochrome-c peroxidase [Flavobacterium tibetense]